MPSLSQPTSAVPPHSPTASEQILAFGTRLTKSLSRDSKGSASTGTGTAVGDGDRSRGWFGRADRSGSRGREIRSSGRGGAGNIRQSSADNSQFHAGGPDDFSVTRGREALPQYVRSSKSVSTGRGGAGNIREGRGVVPEDQALNVVNTGEAAYERRLIREHESSRATGAYPSGRGGAGNIQRQPLQKLAT